MCCMLDILVVASNIKLVQPCACSVDWERQVKNLIMDPNDKC